MTDVKERVENRVAAVRQSRGLGASDLARRVHVSRQTIYAIEAGSYVPNTEVALRLAKELEIAVGDLFSLQQGPETAPESVSAEVLSAAPQEEGRPVRICQIGQHWVGVPVTATPYYMPEADGVIRHTAKTGRADLLVFAKDEAAQKRLLLAGCDPATGLLARMVERVTGVEIVSAAASSKLALSWLKSGKVHIAGSHLEDARTGEFNLPFVEREFPKGELRVVTFARWEEGLVVRSGNPKGIRKVEDLARKNLKFVNREPGSGSRALLDNLLRKAGTNSANIDGYEKVAYGHLAAAYAVVSGEADVCLATRSAAKAFSLDFIPLHSERYDLVMWRRTAELPAVKAFLDVLQRATLRRKLEVLAGYDASETGSVIS